MKLSCVNVVIRSAEDVKLVSTIRESVMQGNFVSENILKFLGKQIPMDIRQSIGNYGTWRTITVHESGFPCEKS